MILWIYSALKCCVARNLPLRGSNEKLYQDSNDNLIGLAEMMAIFDVMMQDHVRCINNKLWNTVSLSWG